LLLLKEAPSLEFRHYLLPGVLNAGITTKEIQVPQFPPLPDDYREGIKGVEKIMTKQITSQPIKKQNHKQMKLRYLFTLILFAFITFTGFSQSENSNDKLRVGVFNGNGASPVCVIETMEALKIDHGIIPQEVSAVDIMNGVLENLDVMVFPGGSASKEYNNLGLLAAEKIKAFGKQKNRGLVGICAGGYLFSTTPGYPSLEIFPAPDIRNHYDRGRALIGFTINQEGAKIFPELKKVDTAFFQYYDGPIYEIPEHSPIEILGELTTDISHKKGYPKKVTPGKPAFFTMDYGMGKAIASIGHPEATPGMRWIVPRMARYVANRELVSYTSQVVRPEIYKQEVLYTKDIISFEKKNFWQLFAEDEQTVIEAIDHLHSVYSRPSIRWSIGLLRHTSPAVRAHAALYLLDTEYTAALPDVKAAYMSENDVDARSVLKEVLDSLNAIVN